MKKFLLLGLILATPLARAYPKMDLSFMMGPSLSQSGGIEKIGDPNTNIVFEFNYFFHKHHGAGISIGNEFPFDGEGSLSRADGASMHLWEVHYAYRHLFSRKVMLTVSPGVGIQTLYSSYDDYYNYAIYEDLSTAWAWNYKILLDYLFVDWDTEAPVFVGAGINQIFSMDDRFGGEDISGSRLSLLFRVGFAF